MTAAINIKRLLTNKLKRLASDPIIRNDEDKKVKCPVCGKEIKPENLDGVEYVKTKRASEIFVHTKCVKKWGK
jgi:hypothetical protein